MVTMDAQPRIRREIAGVLLFVAIGMVVGVFVTGLPRMNHRSSGLGQVSVLMAVPYGTVYLVSPWRFDGLDSLALKNRLLRTLATVVITCAFEWSFGALCRAAGFMPWNCTGAKPGWTTSFSDVSKDFQVNVTMAYCSRPKTSAAR